MRWIYHLIIAFLTIHLLVYMLGEKKLTAKIGPNQAVGQHFRNFQHVEPQCCHREQLSLVPGENIPA
ncbi:MAG: hypothetical protein KKD59_08765, partial [Acidobacteria bacterium]|nr:hypothetical protein [Acidobacteriota bacterium]